MQGCVRSEGGAFEPLASAIHTDAREPADRKKNYLCGFKSLNLCSYVCCYSVVGSWYNSRKDLVQLQTGEKVLFLQAVYLVTALSQTAYSPGPGGDPKLYL